jgi:quaternary ammonium compound-resistance protein SugE
MAFKYNTAWTFVVVGGLIEIGWAYGLKISEGFTRPVPSAITIALLVVSFYFFAKSMTMLETGVAYAVYTGIGTAGTAIVGMAFLGESTDPLRIFFLSLLIGGIIGLKIVTPAESGSKPADEGGA